MSLRTTPTTAITALNPKFEGEYSRRFDLLCRDLADPNYKQNKTLRDARIQDEIDWVSQRHANRLENQRYLTAVLILSDLLSLLSWQIHYSPTGLELVSPPPIPPYGLQPHEISQIKTKQRSELAESVRKQIEHPATQDFIRRMEQPHFQAKHQSITNLIANGEELASRFQALTDLPQDEQLASLAQVVQPYLQLVDPEQRDQFTGIRLGDIWRYFRHTWSIPSMSIPGRQLLYLVRDAAHPYHAVMGIAALSNSAMQLKDRDDYIGWTAETIVNRLTEAIRKADERKLDYLLGLLEGYVEAGIQDIDWRGLVELDEIQHPTEVVVNRLRTLVMQYARERKRELGDTRSGDLADDEEMLLAYEWADVEVDVTQPDVSEEVLALDTKASESRIGNDARRLMIFKKRTYELSRLLAARLIFQNIRKSSSLLETIDKLLKRDEFLVAVNSALVAHKKGRIGINMLEITTCGAVPPYSFILGGKLVALLMLSPQIIADYQERYGNKASLIASQLRNEPVIRPCELVYLGTTSLYGVGSSQYNRLSLPAQLFHPDQPVLRYAEIGLTSGFGTVQFSTETSRELGKMEEMEFGFQDVNHIFGEGFSPKLRKIRAGLSNLGFDSDVILRHNQPRLLYAVELCANARAFLCGEDDNLPEYIVAPSQPYQATQKVADYWRKRWLHMRVQKSEVLETLRHWQPVSLMVQPSLNGSRPKSEGSTQEERDDGMAAIRIPEPRVPWISLEFLQKLYRDTSSYSDRLDPRQRQAINIETPLETYVLDALQDGYSVILTGNAGDGKTHILASLEEQIKQIGVRVILDASAVYPHEIVKMWKSAQQDGVPFCMAANEWPLFTLIKHHIVDLPILENVRQQLNYQLIYSENTDVPDLDESRLIVVDLGKRNHLQAHFFEAALAAILREELFEQCMRCPFVRQCDTTRNRRLLSNERVAERLGELISRLAIMGHHITVRELLAMISFIIFGGRTCPTLANTSGKRDGFYSDQLFSPKARGEIFDLLRKFVDPAMISHPHWDVNLYYNDYSETDWIETRSVEAIYSDKGIELNRQRAIFDHVKRRFFFEHSHGNEALDMIPEDERTFRNWVNPENDDFDSILDEALEAINWFFCPALEQTQLRDELFVWTSHHYDERVPKAFLCQQRIDRKHGDLVIQRPHLAPHLEGAFEYYPDHIRLVVYPQHRDQAPSLDIDYTLFKTLRDVRRGLPPMLVPEEQTIRLHQFMNDVQAANPQSTGDRREILSYIVGSKSIVKSIVRKSSKRLLIDRES